MSIQSEITRLTSARNTIRNKMVNLGLGESTDTLEDLATEIDGIVNQGAVSASVQDGQTYTIPAGYHNGSGTVQGAAGGGNYTLQAKTVTPTKSQQSITPDSGYYGISGVTVSAIPEAYQDVSSVDAAAADVLANKLIVTSDGTLTAGTMVNNGAVSEILTGTHSSYTIPEGYHNGSGTVSIVPELKTVTPTATAHLVYPTNGKVITGITVEAVPTETKNITPTASAQTITPTSGKFISEVTVAAIDGSIYKDTTDATAVAANILNGITAYGYDSVNQEAVKITGSMANNGAVNASINGLSTTSYTIPAGYHNGSGTVSLTSDIESALALI